MKNTLTISLPILFISCYLLTSCGIPSPKEKMKEETPIEKAKLSPASSTLPFPACNDTCYYSDSLVPVSIAANWLQSYRAAYPGAPMAFYYDKHDILSLLQNPSSDGYRLYFGSFEPEEDSIPVFYHRMRLLMIGVNDANDHEEGDVLGFNAEHTLNLGSNNILHGGNAVQEFISMQGEGWLTQTEAAQMTANWRAHHDEGFIQAYTFCINWLCALTSDETVIGMRFYLGLDNDEQLRMVTVAVDQEGNDKVRGESGSEVVDWSAPCPKLCGNASALNSSI